MMEFEFSNNGLVGEYHMHTTQTERISNMNTNQTSNIPQPHRWAEVIKAWADGKIIQSRNVNLSRISNYSDWTDWQQSARHEDQHDAPWFDNGYVTEWRIKPEQKTGWINIYNTPEAGCIFPSKEDAINERSPDMGCIACIQITYTEGEGL